MATTVIIPARNEAVTIGAIVLAFQDHPETHGQVYVGIDADTVDETSYQVWLNGGTAIHTDQRGKGQVINATMSFARGYTPLSDRIILCDGDYTGLTTEHIDKMLSRNDGMVIGVPDWPEIDLPERVISSWPRVSGFRHLPWKLIPDNAHGYMLETQLNIRAIRARMAIPYVWLPGLKSPFQWPLTIGRQLELERDQKWGRENGYG